MENQGERKEKLKQRSLQDYYSRKTVTGLKKPLKKMTCLKKPKNQCSGEEPGAASSRPT